MSEVQTIQNYHQLYSPLQTKIPMSLSQQRSRPLGKIVTQIEMNDPESRKALKAALDQQIKEKQDAKNIERINRFRKDDNQGLVMSNSYNNDGLRFNQTAEEILDPRQIAPTPTLQSYNNNNSMNQNNP